MRGGGVIVHDVVVIRSEMLELISSELGFYDWWLVDYEKIFLEERCIFEESFGGLYSQR